MPNILDVLREVMTLTKSVGVLEHDVEKLGEKVEKHGDRILTLEQREELLAERMTNRAITAVNEMNGKIFEKLAALEHRLPPALSPSKNLSE